MALAAAHAAVVAGGDVIVDLNVEDLAVAFIVGAVGSDGLVIIVEAINIVADVNEGAVVVIVAVDVVALAAVLAVIKLLLLLQQQHQCCWNCCCYSCYYTCYCSL